MQKKGNSYGVLSTLVNTLGRPLSLLKLYKMAQVENVEAQVDTILLNVPIDIVKQKLKLLKDQGTDIHNVYQSYFHFFTTDQALNYQEFVDWCAKHYSVSERVIMHITSSKILYPVNQLVIKKSILVSRECTLKYKDYNKESIVQCFRESIVEKKQEFFKKCFKPDVELLDQTFPVDVGLFNEETQCTVTLLHQFLGLDTNKYITKPLMTLLFVLSTCPVES